MSLKLGKMTLRRQAWHLFSDGSQPNHYQISKNNTHISILWQTLPMNMTLDQATIQHKYVRSKQLDAICAQRTHDSFGMQSPWPMDASDPATYKWPMMLAVHWRQQTHYCFKNKISRALQANKRYART